MSRNFTAYLEICKRSLTEILLSGRDQLFSFSQFQHFQYGLRCSVLRPVIDNNNFLRWHRLIQQTPQFSETKDCRRQRAEPRKVQRAASVQSRELNFRFPLSAFRFPLFSISLQSFRLLQRPCADCRSHDRLQKNAFTKKSCHPIRSIGPAPSAAIDPS